MRKYKIVSIILLVVTCIMCFSGVCLAINNPGAFKPGGNLGTASQGIIKIILNVITGIGICGIFIAITLIGFNIIIGSASEKAIAQEKFVGILIAAIILTSISPIVNCIINIINAI